jgi:superkiller protein 3
VLLNLGSCLHDSGKYNEAIAYYKKAEEVDPHNPLIMENRALAYYSLGQVDQAIEHIRRSLILDPTNSRAQTFLGRALETNGDKEEAIRSYKRAIELDPMNADARLNASFLLDQSGAYEEAAQYARQAIEAYQQKGQKNGVALGYLDLGWYYYRMGRIDESEQASRKSLEIDPSLYGARFNLALAHLRQGRVDEARKEYLEGADSVKLASDLKTWAIDDLNAALQDHSLPGGAEILDELKARYKALRSRRGLDNLPYSPPSPHLKASSTS